MILYIAMQQKGNGRIVPCLHEERSGHDYGVEGTVMAYRKEKDAYYWFWNLCGNNQDESRDSWEFLKAKVWKQLRIKLVKRKI